MSVDYYTCDQCGNICNDHEPEIVFCDCGNHYCSPECAEEAKVVDQVDGDITGIYSVCGYCRGELFNDSDLLKVALSKLEISRKELVEIAKLK